MFGAIIVFTIAVKPEVTFSVGTGYHDRCYRVFQLVRGSEIPAGQPSLEIPPPNAVSMGLSCDVYEGRNSRAMSSSISM